MSDNEDDTTSPDTVYKPSFVLIAIDTNPSMFVKKESDGTMPFRDCISACYNLANSLIFTQNKRSWSPFGVVLAREDASASFVNFNDNVLTSIKFLKEENKRTDDELTDMYQRKGIFDLSAFFLFCKKKFKEVNSVFYKRTIIYVTNDDDPIKSDKNQRFAALNEAKNFEANNITFEMVTMNDSFNYKIFYNELYAVLKLPPVETVVEDEDGLLEKLSTLILVRYYQRRLNFFPFIGDQSRFLKVRQKSFVQEEKLYNNAFVSAEGKLVKKISKTPTDELKKYLLKFNMGSLEFDTTEYYEIKNNDLPIGYSLIHVSDRVTDVGIILANTAIMEVDVKEEIPFFESFWQYCVDKNKVLICIRKLKKFDKIRFVELIPKFAQNTKLFIIKIIPFNDENKYPASRLTVKEEDINVEYSQEKVTVTDKLINSLTFDYDPKMFTNLSLAKKKAFLRAKLLQDPEEDVEDVTLDSEAIDKSLNEVGDDFKNLFHLEEETGKKRRAPSTASKSKKKK
jgi:hypothetical protein